MIAVSPSPTRLRLATAFALALVLPATGFAQANARSGFVPLRADVTAAPLSNPVSVSAVDVPLGDVIRGIVQQAGLSVALDESLPGLEQRISLKLGRVSAAAALVRALQDTSLQAMVSPTGQVVIVRRVVRQTRALTLRGTILETGTAEPVAGARIELSGTVFQTLSRADGSFSFGRLPAGEYNARVTRLGYRPVMLTRLSVTETADSTAAIPINVTMERGAIPLSAVVVTPGYFGVMQASAAAPVAMSRQQIETVPQIGEDIYRAVNRLPGVAAGDFSAKFSVRGGSGDELYATLDGLELVEPYHLKDILEGALSILDSKAIGSLELTTGGFSSEYGDRLTGVFTMRSVDPRTDRTRTSLGASLMNVRATSQGGFADGRGGWLLSVRRGYLDIAMKLANANDSLNPTYYDTFGKVQYDLASGGRIAAHVLHAGDNLKYLDDPSIRSRYTSSYAWLTWDDRFGSRLRQQTVASVGRLTWRRRGDAFDIPQRSSFPGQKLSVNDQRTYDVVGLRQDWSVDVAPRLLFKWGADLRRERADYHYFSWRRILTVDDASNEIVQSFDTTDVGLEPSSTRLGAYVASRVRPVRAVTAELGVRLDRATHTGDEIVSPRFNVAWHPASRTTVRGAWGAYSQSQSLYGLQAQDGEATFYPAERAEQRVLGVEQVIKNGLVARAELYERRLSHLRPRYVNVGASIEVFPEINWDRVRVDPTTGTARGVELFLSRDGAQHVDWSLSYALASAREQIGGRTVPRTVDQRHTIHGDWSYRPTSDKWRLNVAWLWHSGWPYTPPLIAVDTLQNTQTNFSLFGTWYPGEINSGRLPAYRRADVRWTRYFDTRRGRWSFFAEVYNLLGTDNPRGYYVNLNVNGRTVTTPVASEENIGRLPSLGLTWEF